MALGGKHSLPGFEQSLEELRADILLIASLVRRSLSNAKTGLVRRDEDHCSAANRRKNSMSTAEKAKDTMKTLNAEKITARPAPKNRREHSVPWFWPLAAGIELGEEGLRLYQDNLRYLAEAEEITFPPPPEWATVNRILLDLDTMRVRDFSPSEARSTDIPVLVDAPYAGHSSTIADYAKGQSLVETLQAGGLDTSRRRTTFSAPRRSNGGTRTQSICRDPFISRRSSNCSKRTG